MMQLPSDSVGITDILAYRECPQRFAWGMKRHTPLPERFQVFPGEKADPPGHVTQANAYGSAIHGAIFHVEQDACSDTEAIDRVWHDWQHWLEPEDVERMRADLQTYRTRSASGYRVVMAEKDCRVPLFVHEGRQIFFRFKVDLLLQHLQNPGVFLMRDYKSGRMPKSEKGIHRDLQQWSYNMAIHEYLPEVRTLIQIYDQLRYGATPTQKSDHQRRQIRDWLIRQVTAILRDEQLKPTQNDFCEHCELLMDCRVTHLAPTYWRRRVAAMAPEEKVGRKLTVKLAAERYGEYVKLLPEVSSARKMLKRFEDTVKEDLRAMPAERRERLGYLVKERRGKVWRPEVLPRVAEVAGPQFWHLIKLTMTALEEYWGKRGSDAAEGSPLQPIIDLADEQVTATYVERIPE